MDIMENEKLKGSFQKKPAHVNTFKLGVNQEAKQALFQNQKVGNELSDVLTGGAKELEPIKDIIKSTVAILTLIKLQKAKIRLPELNWDLYKTHDNQVDVDKILENNSIVPFFEDVEIIYPYKDMDPELFLQDKRINALSEELVLNIENQSKTLIEDRSKTSILKENSQGAIKENSHKGISYLKEIQRVFSDEIETLKSEFDNYNSSQKQFSTNDNAHFFLENKIKQLLEEDINFFNVLGDEKGLYKKDNFMLLQSTFEYHINDFNRDSTSAIINKTIDNLDKFDLENVASVFSKLIKNETRKIPLNQRILS